MLSGVWQNLGGARRRKNNVVRYQVGYAECQASLDINDVLEFLNFGFTFGFLLSILSASLTEEFRRVTCLQQSLVEITLSSYSPTD